MSCMGMVGVTCTKNPKPINVPKAGPTLRANSKNTATVRNFVFRGLYITSMTGLLHNKLSFIRIRCACVCHEMHVFAW